MLIVDTGVLLAAADVNDPDHDVCAALLRDEPGELVTTALVIAETAYLMGAAPVEGRRQAAVGRAALA